MSSETVINTNNALPMETEDSALTDSSGPVTEEYAYLDRGGFSSEKFKIELKGLPKFYGIAELKKLMNQKLGLNTSKIKRPRHGSHWLYACFQNEEDRTKAIAALNGYSWKGKNLVAQIAQPAPDPFVKKRKQEEESYAQIKRSKVDKGQEERLKDATTPYWNVSYDEQLKMKEKEIKELLMKMDNEIWKCNRDVRAHIELNRKTHSGLSFQMTPIQRSPRTEGYRNKCEFTVGIDEETQLPTVGFRLGSYVTGTVAVAPVGSLAHISDDMKKACLIFEQFVRKSGMMPFSPADYSGYWRQLTVRQSHHTGELMLIVALYRQKLTQGEMDELKEKLVRHFSSDDAKACNITSLYYELLQKRYQGLVFTREEASLDDSFGEKRQSRAVATLVVTSIPPWTLKRAGEEGSKPIHLMGSTHITDTILDHKFMISPQAFFQINTRGADILYQSAIDMCRPRENTTVVDICCGTGTIGLCFAKHCSRVLGVELVPAAVEDAKANAELNNIGNCDFFTGRAEDTLPSVLARALTKDVVAVVDPPRAGLHMRAVTQLRNNKKVNRLVYMSCSPAAALKNFVDLARPSSKTLRGAPFMPVRAVPVDMFPHTRHIELAILFERIKQEPITDENGQEESTEEFHSEINIKEEFKTEELFTEGNGQVKDSAEEEFHSEINIKEEVTEEPITDENGQEESTEELHSEINIKEEVKTEEPITDEDGQEESTEAVHSENNIIEEIKTEV